MHVLTVLYSVCFALRLDLVCLVLNDSTHIWNKSSILFCSKLYSVNVERVTWVLSHGLLMVLLALWVGLGLFVTDLNCHLSDDAGKASMTSFHFLNLNAGQAWTEWGHVEGKGFGPMKNALFRFLRAILHRPAVSHSLTTLLGTPTVYTVPAYSWSYRLML